MYIQERDKLPSQYEASTSSKIEGNNVVSSTFYNDMPSLTIAVSLRSGKELDEPISTTFAK